MSGVDGVVDIVENVLFLLRGRGCWCEFFIEDGVDKGFQFCCIY